jgi:hypothetical protein
MRKKYDPRELIAALEQRNKAAQEAAQQFGAALSEGRLDPSAEGFNQGEEPELAFQKCAQRPLMSSETPC